MCGGQAEKRIEETLEKHAVADGGNAYQHAMNILNGACVHEDQAIVSLKDLRNSSYKLKIWGLILTHKYPVSERN
jgi:hypothetical protein